VFCPCFVWFCRKGTKARRFYGLLFLWVLWAEKVSKLYFGLVLFREKMPALLLASDFLLKTTALAPIEVEILLLFSLKSKRLERIAGIAPYKN